MNIPIATLTIISVVFGAVNSSSIVPLPPGVDSLIRTEYYHSPGVMDTVRKYVERALSERDSFLIDYYNYLQVVDIQKCHSISTVKDCNLIYIEQLQSISQDLITRCIINREFNRAANLIRLSKRYSMHHCIGAWNKETDSVFHYLSKLAGYDKSKYATDEFVKTEFDAWINFCAAGVFRYGEACSPNYDMCACKADSIEKQFPKSSNSAYSRYRILELWTHGDGEYGKFQSYAPKDMHSYLLMYPQSKFSDEVKLFICLIPLRGHAVDIDEKMAVSAFLDSCNKYLPSIKDSMVLKKLNDTKTLFLRQAASHGIKLEGNYLLRYDKLSLQQHPQNSP